jgi:hypothetical protein
VMMESEELLKEVILNLLSGVTVVLWVVVLRGVRVQVNRRLMIEFLFSEGIGLLAC